MNRRKFVKKAGSGLLALGVGGLFGSRPLRGAATPSEIKWSLEPRPYKPLGPMDLIPQMDEGQRWANESLIKYGTVEPPNGGNKNRCMRAACMPAESCAHYYSMTGDPLTLEALRAAVRTFREYRHKARGRRVPYTRLERPVATDFSPGPPDRPTIEYQMISCHVGRNMRGMRAAAHVLKDEKLLREVAEELNWWIDNPLAFNTRKHFFDARIFVDENGKTIGSERKYTLNMAGSLACAMWLVGNDLSDQRLKDYAEEQVLEGIAPQQSEEGYFPYNIAHRYEMVDGVALDTNYYHAVTMQVLSPLLAYAEWRAKTRYVEMMRRGVRYLRHLITDFGVFEHPPHIYAIRRSRGRGRKDPYEATADAALIHARVHKYLGDADALQQLSRILRWMHFNATSCIPFLPLDMGLRRVVSECGFSHTFRQIMLVASEGFHLKQKGARDVETVLVG